MAEPRSGRRETRASPGGLTEDDAIDGVRRACDEDRVSSASALVPALSLEGREGRGRPLSRSGSSLGEGGGGGTLKSISGGSFLIVNMSFFCFFVVVDFRLLDFDIRSGDTVARGGVWMISRGGVNCSRGGSYGGIGVAERRREEIVWREITGRGGM